MKTAAMRLTRFFRGWEGTSTASFAPTRPAPRTAAAATAIAAAAAISGEVSLPTDSWLFTVVEVSEGGSDETAALSLHEPLSAAMNADCIPVELLSPAAEASALP